MKTAKNFKCKSLAFVLAALLCFFGAGEFLIRANTAYAATDATVSALENRIKENKERQKEILAQITEAKANRKEYIEYKAYVDEQMNLTIEEISIITELIAELDNKIAEKEIAINTTSEEIEKQYENFQQIMRLSYEEGNASYVEMVLGAENFYDFLVRLEQVTSLMDYCRDLLSDLKQNKADLEADKATLEESKAAQLMYQDNLKSAQEDLELIQEETEIYISNIDKVISENNATYQKYLAEEEKLDKELEEKLRELQARENAAYVGGEFNWPLPLKWKNISSNYGPRTLYGVKEFHRGIDIPAYAGTNIYASNAGKVITATYHYSYGNYVVIDHGGGKSTLYAHATKLNCKVGDVVKQGDVIAFVGTTGNSYGNHLHFEVRINGTHKNPLDYVVQP